MDENKQMLSDDIMGCQGILDDLRAVLWRLDDRHEDIDPVELTNCIQGLEALYEIKFKKLWETFNDV